MKSVVAVFKNRATHWHMRWGLAFAAAFGALAGLVIYTWPVTVQYLPFFSVTYSKGLGKGLVIEVVNEKGQPVIFCATLYGWLPNGTFEKIGWKCGRGTIHLDKGPLDRYVKHFENRTGEVGILVFLTYVNGTEGGRPIMARHVSSFTVDPRKTLTSDVVKATLKVKSKGGGGGGVRAAFALQWPPSSIDEGCYAADTWYVCYQWELDYVYASGSGGIPISAVRIPLDYDKIYVVFAKAYLEVKQTNYIYFRGGAAVKYNNVIKSFSGDIATYTLTYSKIYLNVAHTVEAYKIGKPFILAVGFYGDYAVARYKEVQYDPSGAKPTGYTADMYLIRPWQYSDGTVVQYVEVDNSIYDDYGASGFVTTAVTYLTPVRVDAQNGINLYVDSVVVKQSVNSIDLFAVGIPLPKPVASYVSSQITAGIGQVQQVTALAVAYAVLRESYRSSYYLWGYYYKPQYQSQVSGYLVGVPALYISAYVNPK